MRRSLVPLLISVLVVYSAQQMLTPLLAPLSRELGLSETQLGTVVTVGAAALTVFSLVWGRVLDRWGVRTVLVTGLVLATVGLLGFGLVAAVGVGGGFGSGETFALMLLARGLVLGVGAAALPVAAQAAVATTTTGEAERTRGIGLVGAAQGLSLVLGPAVGGAVAAVSLLLPLWIAPAITAAALVVVLVTIKKVPRDGTAVVASGKRIRPWDRRIVPYLAIGFLLYLALGFVQVIIGFLLADRVGLAPQATAGAVGASLFAAGLALVITQAVIVPKLGWGAMRLLRVGAPIVIVALLGLAFADQLWSVIVAVALIGLGLGMATPGFATAPTLVVTSEEQGTIAGLVTATMAATFIVGPVVGTSLYEIATIVPILAGLAAAVVSFVVAWLVRPAARDADRQDDDAGTSTATSTETATDPVSNPGAGPV